MSKPLAISIHKGQNIARRSALSLTCALFILLTQTSFAQSSPADEIKEGENLVSIDFPEPTEIRDIIRAVARWTGKNVIVGKRVAGKIQMISPNKVTKEEAYQAFLSALNVAGYTTVETGKIIKIVPIMLAARDNLNIYQSTTWTPRTDKFITQIIPLRYIDTRQARLTLSRLMRGNSIVAYQPTNSLIVSDTGNKVRRIMEIIKILDVAGKQPKVALVPIRYSDAKTVAAKVNELIAVRPLAPAKKGAKPIARGNAPAMKISVDERSNSVVLFGSPQSIASAKDLIKTFDFPLEDSENQKRIRIRFLDYADAKKVATTLSSLTSTRAPGRRLARRSLSRPRASASRNTSSNAFPLISSLGEDFKISSDPSTNSLLITGSGAAYQAINGIIRKLDRRQPQVYVEADILDVNLSNGFTFGTSVLLGDKSGSTTRAYGWQGSRVAPVIIGQSATSTDASKLSVASALSTDFTLGVLSGKSIDIPGIGSVTPAGLITMLKSDSNTKVLSSPHLLTTNNEVAKIVVGDTIFYKTAVSSAAIGQGAIEKVEKENADLSLEIKPNISHSGQYVTLKLDLEANEGGLDPTTNVPKINKRQSSQLVTLKNGQTAVVSGLVKRRETEVYQKIPLLGDIPLLGWLFRNSELAKETTSLMVFLTPHVIFGANDLAAIYEKKLAEKERMLAQAFGTDSDDSFNKALPTRADGQFKEDDLDRLEKKEQDDLHPLIQPTKLKAKPGSEANPKPTAQTVS